MCARYTWQASAPTYRYQGCTGAVWANGRGGQLNDGLTDVCVLKSNISTGIEYTFNESFIYPGYDGAVLLFE